MRRRSQTNAKPQREFKEHATAPTGPSAVKVCHRLLQGQHPEHGERARRPRPLGPAGDRAASSQSLPIDNAADSSKTPRNTSLYRLLGERPPHRRHQGHGDRITDVDCAQVHRRRESNCGVAAWRRQVRRRLRPRRRARPPLASETAAPDRLLRRRHLQQVRLPGASVTADRSSPVWSRVAAAPPLPGFCMQGEDCNVGSGLRGGVCNASVCPARRAPTPSRTVTRPTSTAAAAATAPTSGRIPLLGRGRLHERRLHRQRLPGAVVRRRHGQERHRDRHRLRRRLPPAPNGGPSRRRLLEPRLHRQPVPGADLLGRRQARRERRRLRRHPADCPPVATTATCQSDVCTGACCRRARRATTRTSRTGGDRRRLRRRHLRRLLADASRQREPTAPAASAGHGPAPPTLQRRCVKERRRDDVDCGGPSRRLCERQGLPERRRLPERRLPQRHVCQVPCNDGVRNGAETDVDCGGGTCAACGAGQACSVHATARPVCTGNVCRPATSDGVKNGAETVDCGGGSCAGCGAKGCHRRQRLREGSASPTSARRRRARTASRTERRPTSTGGGSCGDCALNKSCSASDCLTNFAAAASATSEPAVHVQRQQQQRRRVQLNAVAGGNRDAERSGRLQRDHQPANDNIDRCTLAAPFYSVNSFSGLELLARVAGRRRLPAGVVPPAIGSCCSGRPSCSAGAERIGLVAALRPVQPVSLGVRFVRNREHARAAGPRDRPHAGPPRRRWSGQDGAAGGGRAPWRLRRGFCRRLASAFSRASSN